MYKRKRTSRSYTRRVRRRVGRALPRVARSLRLNTLAFKRKQFMFNWQPSTASTADFWKYLGFAFSSLTNNAEISSMFDEYKICALKWEFHPRFDSFAGNDTTDTTLPGITNQSGTKLHICIDQNSTMTPTGTYNSGTLNGFMENGNVRTYSGNRVVTVYYRPKVFNTVQSTSAQPIKSPWLITSASFQHWGFHAFAQDNNFNGSFGQSWDVYCTAYMKVRNVR